MWILTGVTANEWCGSLLLTAAVLYTPFNLCPFVCLQVVDWDIVMFSAHWERRRTALTELQEQLQSLPAFISELDAITANIGMNTV